MALENFVLPLIPRLDGYYDHADVEFRTSTGNPE